MNARRPLDWSGPRNLTGGDGYTVDLGMVTAYDAARYGRSRTLIPHASGRLIKSVRFIPSNSDAPTAQVIFATPNTITGFNNSAKGMAYVSLDDLQTAVDTFSLVNDSSNTGLSGDSGVCQIIDSGPLIAVTDAFCIGQPMLPWQPLTAYANDDYILVGTHVLSSEDGGVSGTEEPPDTGGGDGNITWDDQGELPTGSVHAIAEVMEGVSPAPPYPATIEFIDQPTDTVSGQLMSPPVTVILKDQNGDPYKFSEVQVKLQIYGAPTILTGTANINTDKSTGIATFSDITPISSGTAFIIRARINPWMIEAIYSDPFDVTAP